MNERFISRMEQRNRIPHWVSGALVLATVAIAVGQSLGGSAITQKQESVAGLYLGAPSNITFVTPHSPTGLRQLAGKDYMVLYPNGDLLRQLPPGGLDNFNVAEDKAAHPTHWGTYTVSAKRIVIHWGSSRTDFIAERAPGGFYYQSDPYVLLPKTNNVHLEGTYQRQDGWESKRRITFKGDGTFYETGLIGHYIGLAIYPVSGAGIYQIRNHSLYLNYNDGRYRKISYFTLPKEGGKAQPSQIFLNALELSRNAVIDSPVKPTEGAMLAKGDPPLMQTMADTITNHFQWLMDRHFTPEQRRRIQQYLVEYWTTNNTEEIKNSLQCIRSSQDRANQPEYVRKYHRESNIGPLIEAWRKATNDPLSLYLVEIYEAAHG